MHGIAGFFTFSNWLSGSVASTRTWLQLMDLNQLSTYGWDTLRSLALLDRSFLAVGLMDEGIMTLWPVYGLLPTMSSLDYGTQHRISPVTRNPYSKLAPTPMAS